MADSAAGASRPLRRRAVLAGGVGVAAASVVGVDPASATPALAKPKPTGGDAGEAVRIGVLLDLEGGFKEHRTRQRDGVVLQAKLINVGQWGDGFRQVELVTRESDSDDAVRDLVEREKVQALVTSPGPTRSGFVFAAATEAKIPLVLCNPGTPPRRPHAFRTGVGSRQSMLRLMESLRVSNLHAAGMLVNDGLDRPGYREWFDWLGHQCGVDLVAIESYSPARIDASLLPQLRRIINAKPDVLIVHGVPPFVPRAVHQARGELGWEGPIYCGPGAGSQVFLNQARPYAEGVHVVAPWVLRAESAPEELPNRATMIQFAHAYQQEYREPVGVYAACGADAVALLSRAFLSTDDSGLARLRLEEMVYDGVTGPFRMTLSNHTGLSNNVVTTFVVRDGKWEPTT